MPPNKIDVDIAERLIIYKKKMSEMWLEKQPKPIKDNEESESEENYIL